MPHEPQPSHPPLVGNPGFFLLFLAVVSAVAGLLQDRNAVLQLGLLILTGFLMLSWAVLNAARR